MNSQINPSDLLYAIKQAWFDCYHTLIPKDAQDESEEVSVYKAWVDWIEAGQMRNNPLFNIVLGHTVGSKSVPSNLWEYNMDEMRDMYLKTGHEALKQLIEELEQDDDEQ